MNQNYDLIIQQHYKEQASTHGLEPSSTMLDLTTRDLETSAILNLVEYLFSRSTLPFEILEIGCGNGNLLELISGKFSNLTLTGIDFNTEMVELALARQINNCDIKQGDVRNLQLPDATFDVIISERCLINILDVADQVKAVQELWRVLKPSGYVIFLESFQDGLENLNKARRELGLSDNSMPHHNLWFEKNDFFNRIKDMFDVLESNKLESYLPGHNFLSSHYFISRVFYPCVTKSDILYNTEFVKFFQFLPPIGNYSPIQLFLLRKIDGQIEFQ
jgi:SAM-dependent methyltransferase